MQLVARHLNCPRRHPLFTDVIVVISASSPSEAARSTRRLGAHKYELATDDAVVTSLDSCHRPYHALEVSGCPRNTVRCRVSVPLTRSASAGFLVETFHRVAPTSRGREQRGTCPGIIFTFHISQQV